MSWDVCAWGVNTLRKLIENHGVQKFTSDGTFVVPEGVHKILVTACGGGGGGGGSSFYGGSGGGASGECIYRHLFAVTPGSEISIMVGAGGAGGAGNTGSVDSRNCKNGENGGATVIGDLVTLSGGVGGNKPSNGYFGGDGASFFETNTSGGGGGGGCIGRGGNGGTGGSSAINPTTGGYGSGGGGAPGNNKTAISGADGGPGVVIIEY